MLDEPVSMTAALRTLLILSISVYVLNIVKNRQVCQDSREWNLHHFKSLYHIVFFLFKGCLEQLPMHLHVTLLTIFKNKPGRCVRLVSKTQNY